MREQAHISVAPLVLALALFSGSSALGEEIELSQVSDVVKNAAVEALPGIVLVEAELERKANGAVYELEGLVDGKRYEIELTEAGRVLKIELEDSEKVALSDVPRPARDAVLAAVPGIELVGAETVRGERGLYEIEGRSKGTTYEILVTGNGNVLEIESDSDSDSEDDGADDEGSKGGA